MSIDGIPKQDISLASSGLVSHVDFLLQAVPTSTSDFLHQYATVYYGAGRYADTAQLEFAELEKQRKILGDDHPITLDVMHNFLAACASIGQFEEIERLKPHIAARSLAITYDDLGRFDEAGKLTITVLEKRRRLLGADHLETLHAMNNLGWTYYCQGDFEKAKELQDVVLEKRRGLLGEDHPDTQLALRNLADVVIRNFRDVSESCKDQLHALGIKQLQTNGKLHDSAPNGTRFFGDIQRETGEDSLESMQSSISHNTSLAVHHPLEDSAEGMKLELAISEVPLENLVPYMAPIVAILNDLNEAFAPPFVQVLGLLMRMLGTHQIFQTVKQNKKECVQLVEGLHQVLTLHKIYTYIEGQQDSNKLKHLFRNISMNNLVKDCYRELDDAKRVLEVGHTT
ncbi:hypothetical protein C8R45DRAFT_928474 [Mycena sanguinolenta]|nr:hypothetical protein C8R45DRAFT_928474 [Mycena sanguinolenta]